MLTNSTCSTCPHRNEFGNCSLMGECIHTNIALQPEVMAKCCSCGHVLKDGDYLTHMTCTDNGIVFEEIVAHYCPVCGGKLKGR